MIVLGIDTSCDDTSISIWDEKARKVISEAVSSRIELHAKFGGVVPEIAARQHLELLLPMIERSLDECGITPGPGAVGLIAVTRGPGLIGGLLVGFSCAKALSLGWGTPFVGVNHVEGHLVSALLGKEKIPYPHVALVVSGGHSELYRALGPIDYELLGETRDDAVGELLDKVGRLLGVGFPAGKTIDEWAVDADRYGPHPTFPRPLISQDNLEFSFSGLKTACLYYLKSDEAKKVKREAIGAEVLRAAVDSLLAKSVLACDREGLDTLVISGGVAASIYLRKEALERSRKAGIRVIFPDVQYCTDNAAMVALAGVYKYRETGPDSYDLDCEASLSVGSR